MSTQTSKIDIAIVNYNTKTYLRRLLNTLESQSNLELFKIFIADNGSQDGSVEYLTAYSKTHPDTEIVFNENIGYGRACNQLAAMGQSEYIALCNSDIWFTNSYQIEALMDILNNDQTISILGPKQRDESGYVTAGGIFGTLEAPKHRGWKVYDPEDHLYRDRQEAVTVAGSAYFIRRPVWNELTNCDVYKGLEVCQNSGVPLGAFLPTPHYY